jgi:hypothetical protein
MGGRLKTRGVCVGDADEVKRCKPVATHPHEEVMSRWRE